jgi:PST family polysaccharide transporter
VVNKFIVKIQRAAKLDIVKVFSFTSISTMVKMLAGFISVKVVAVIIGPAGIALLGQLNNFSTIIMSIATGGITTGVTKYIAQYKDEPDVTREYIGTAVKITLFFSVICGLFLISCASILSLKILLDAKYSFVFIIFGVTLVFYTCNTLLLAIINGYKQFNLYVKISIITSIVGLLLSMILVFPFGINGALINAVTSQSLVFVLAFFMAKRANLACTSFDNLWGKFNKTKAIQYFRFSLMALVSALTVPVSQIIIRSFIIRQFSIQDAGCWEGINRLSNMYLLVITSSFGVYYLPKLSETSDFNMIKREIKTAYKVIVPCLLIGLAGVYFARFIIIKILFSGEFYEMSDLFLWRVIGDFVKISSWLIAYLMHAKAMARLFILTEISFAAFYIGMAFFFGNLIGLQGVVMGYAINYAVYFIVVYLVIFRRRLWTITN